MLGSLVPDPSLLTTGVQSVVSGPAESAALGNSLEMQTLKPSPRPADSSDSGVEISNLI